MEIDKDVAHMIVIGIDPGLDTENGSPTALAALDMRAKSILCTRIFTKGLFTTNEDKIRYISANVRIFLLEFLSSYEEKPILVSIENFLMRGKAGTSLQQLRGGLIGALPDCVDDVNDPWNTTIKKVVGGTGRADKEQVAQGILKLLPKEREYIQELIDRKLWDQTDAIAIALTGYYSWNDSHAGWQT